MVEVVAHRAVTIDVKLDMGRGWHRIWAVVGIAVGKIGYGQMLAYGQTDGQTVKLICGGLGNLGILQVNKYLPVGTVGYGAPPD